MNYNLNTSWGRVQTSGFPFRATGKHFLVAKSAVANRSMLSDLFRDDPDGDPKIFTTIDAAIGACTANAGDVIYVAPGHTESLSAATSLVADVAGVRIVGLGEGATRPTLTWDTDAAATLTVSAANVTIENMNLDMTGVDAVAVGITLSAANFTLRGCKVTTADSAGQCVLPMSATAADDLLIENNLFTGELYDGTTTALDLQYGKRMTVKNNTFIGAYTAAIGAIRLAQSAEYTLSCEHIAIENNFIYNISTASTVCIYSGSEAGVSGHLSKNLLRIRTAQGGSWQFTYRTSDINAGSLELYENYGVNEDGHTAMLIGGVDQLTTVTY